MNDPIDRRSGDGCMWMLVALVLIVFVVVWIASGSIVGGAFAVALSIAALSVLGLLMGGLGL